MSTQHSFEGGADAIDRARAKLRIQELWSLLDLPGIPSRSCRSPFREDRHASFSVYDDGRRWKDFGTDEGGDALEFLAKARGLHRRAVIKEFLALSGDLPAVPAPMRAPIAGAPRPDRHQLIREDLEKCQAAARLLAGDLSICERIAQRRGWKPETIRNLALEPSLGWHNGKLTFVYDTGMKARYDQDGERRLFWMFGKPSLWRGWLLLSKPYHRTVIITEGETDTVSMVDTGIEDDLSTAVVALPSASTITESWFDALCGRDVIIALDNDEAGAAGTRKLEKILQARANSLSSLNWKKLISHAG